MPRSGPQTRQAGRTRSDEEYLEWAARVTRDVEDLRASTDRGKWDKRIQDAYNFSNNADLRALQMNALWERGVTRMYDQLPHVGVSTLKRSTARGTYMQYRDTTTNRFIGLKEVTSRVQRFYKKR